MLVQALDTKPTIERLVECIIRGLSWPAEVELGAVEGGPWIQAPRDEFWSVVAASRALWLVRTGCDSESSVNRASIATRNATQQASALDSEEPHKTTEPAATIQVATGSSGIAPVRKTDRRQEAAQKNSRQGP